ncbi:MAG: hypothetical protein JWN84_3444 [Nocardioides sp.]|nr:hypothetical protein [Nocardioides sp.]
MSDKSLPRPPQATFCGGAILVGSVFVVLLAFGRMASLGTIEAQEEAQLFADSVGNGIGIDAEGWQTAMRVLCIIAGGLGVVTAYLGWRVLQRDRTARLALSVLAPITLVTGIAVADFVPAVMAVAVLLLWRQPTRDWFNGVAAPSRPKPTPVAAGSVPVPSTAPSQGPGRTGQVAPQGTSYPPPAPYARPGGAHAAQPVGHGGRGARPATVLTAAVATIVSSVVVIAMLAVALLFILGDRASFETDMEDELSSQQAYQDLDIDGGVITDVFIGLLAVFIVWALLAIVLAVLTLRGSNAARITLVVSAIAAALASLVGVLVVVPLLITAACITVAVLLLRGEAAAWFAPRQRS